MTARQHEFLKDNGFLILRSAFSSGAVSHLLNALSDLPSAHAHRNLLSHPAIAHLATSNEACALVRPFLGNARPVRGILFDKLPGANWKVPWHQDLSIAVKSRHDVAGYGPWSVKDGVPHVQPPAAVLEQMLTLRLHLDDCFNDNGPVRVVPGSHRLGILAPEEIAAARSSSAEVTTALPAGGVLLMRPLLLHASSPAASPKHRRVIHIEYANVELPPPLQWHAA
jgi:hypothetical protein